MKNISLEDKLVIKSDLQNIGEIEKLIDNISNLCNFDDEVYGRLLLAIVEAANNAITHGNHENADLDVTIEYSINGSEIVFSITDMGNGFDYNSIPDPTAPENIDKPCGRGIYLMRHLSDEITFEDEGRRVNIKFNIA